MDARVVQVQRVDVGRVAPQRPDAEGHCHEVVKQRCDVLRGQQPEEPRRGALDLGLGGACLALGTAGPTPGGSTTEACSDSPLWPRTWPGCQASPSTNSCFCTRWAQRGEWPRNQKPKAGQPRTFAALRSRPAPLARGWLRASGTAASGVRFKGRIGSLAGLRAAAVHSGRDTRDFEGGALALAAAAALE